MVHPSEAGQTTSNGSDVPKAISSKRKPSEKSSDKYSPPKLSISPKLSIKEQHTPSSSRVNSVIDVLIQAGSMESIVLGHHLQSLPWRAISGNEKKNKTEEASGKKKDLEQHLGLDASDGTSDDTSDKKNFSPTLAWKSLYSRSPDQAMGDRWYLSAAALSASSSPIDYLKLWGYDAASAGKHQAYVETTDIQNKSYLPGTEERLGLLEEQQAHSIVDRMIRMKQIGGDQSEITPDELVLISS